MMANVRTTPQPGDYPYSLRRYYVDRFLWEQVPLLEPGSLVLDLGGNRIRKRGRFDIDDYDLRVTVVNLVPDKKPDVCADAADLPFEDGRFQVVVCSEMMEHVADPGAVLRESARVLMSGGILLMQSPFLYRIHGDPSDYGRYTDHYWRLALETAGFKVMHIERQGAFYAVMIDFLRQYCYEMEQHSRHARWLRRCLPWIERWALARDNLPGVRENAVLASFTTGFGIVARKR